MFATAPSLRHRRAILRAHEARARAAAGLWRRVRQPRAAATSLD